jgi:hypothetical protein
MEGPIFELNGLFEGLETTDALTIQSQCQASLGQEAVFEFLDLEIILQGLFGLDHFVSCVQVQLRDRQFPFEADAVRLQMTEIDK